ncbi:MAG TPA: barstar family protein [Myxococcota bacterium]|nr:barstar family protein [Myxococcota bacterium]
MLENNSLGVEMKRTVEIDVSAVRTREQLHELLFIELGLPDYYGSNWDAFDECIADPEARLPERVRVLGMSNLEAILPREARLFRECATQPKAIPSFEWIP